MRAFGAEARRCASGGQRRRFTAGEPGSGEMASTFRDGVAWPVEVTAVFLTRGLSAIYLALDSSLGYFLPRYYGRCSASRIWSLLRQPNVSELRICCFPSDFRGGRKSAKTWKSMILYPRHNSGTTVTHRER